MRHLAIHRQNELADGLAGHQQIGRARAGFVVGVAADAGVVGAERGREAGVLVHCQRASHARPEVDAVAGVARRCGTGQVGDVAVALVLVRAVVRLPAKLGVLVVQAARAVQDGLIAIHPGALRAKIVVHIAVGHGEGGTDARDGRKLAIRAQCHAISLRLVTGIPVDVALIRPRTQRLDPRILVGDEAVAGRQAGVLILPRLHRTVHRVQTAGGGLGHAAGHQRQD